MKKIFIVFCILFVYANAAIQMSLVDIYRKQGKDAVAKQIEAILQSPFYWKSYLEDKDVNLGYYEYDTPIVIVNKSEKTIKLFQNKDNKYTFIESENVIIGKMGDKEKEGDLKTPVGSYEIKRRFVPSDTFYGPLAFELSYPNLFDKLNNKSGHGIWIHGFPLDNSKRNSNTKGCIALQNNDIKDFDKKLQSTQAVVIITEKDKVQASKDVIANILAELFKWKNAWKYNNLQNYLSFYDPNFIRFDGKNRSEFATYKSSIFQKQQSKIIEFNNISIVPYPDINEKNLFLIKFDEIYKTDSYSFSGKKELYIKVVNDKMKILTEK